MLWEVTCHIFENVNIFDIFHCRLDTASKQTHKGADAPKVIHEC